MLQLNCSAVLCSSTGLVPGKPWTSQVVPGMVYGTTKSQIQVVPSVPGQPWTSQVVPGMVYALQKMTCYFDNCICYQNCNCDMFLRDDAMLVPCETSSPCGIQLTLYPVLLAPVFVACSINAGEGLVKLSHVV